MLVCDAVRAFRDEVDAKSAHDRQAWQDAYAASDVAQAAARPS